MRAARWIIAILACVFLSGCYDKIELEERGFVTAVGMDFKDGEYKTGMAFPNLTQLIENKDDKVQEILSGSGKTPLGAMDKAAQEGSLRPYFGHAKVIVMGEGLLSSPEALREVLDVLDRNQDLGKSLHMVATDEDPNEVIGAKTPGASLLGSYITRTYRNTPPSTVKTDLLILVEGVRQRGTALIPRIAIVDENPTLGGAAAIRNGAFAGWLDDEELRGRAWFTGESGEAIIESTFDGHPVGMNITKSKSKIRFSEEDGQLLVTADVYAEGQLTQMDLEKSLEFGELEQLEEIFTKVIEEDIFRFWEKLYVELKTDGLNLHDRLRKQKPEMYGRYKELFSERLSEIGLITEIRLIIKGTGAAK